MRAPVPVLLLALAACASPEFTAPEGGGSQVSLVAISGQVIDSVTRLPIAGAKIRLSGKFEVANAEGTFHSTVAADTLSIHISVEGYESFDRTITPVGAGPFILTLRRLAPVPVSCELIDSTFVAVVIDLQGRKSLERWSESSLTLVGAVQTTSIGALHWGYLPLDTYRWQVSVPATPTLTRVDWDLFDSEGHEYRGSCEPVAPPPVAD